MHKLGDTIEASLWFNSEREDERRSAETAIYKVFHSSEDAYGFRLGPVTFEVREYGDERVPEPPPFFAGTPKVLIGFADVVKLVPRRLGTEPGFTQDLEQRDLNRLRAMTQAAYLSNNPGKPLLTDEQLDATINEVGPETALRSLRAGVDLRVVN